MVQYPDEGERRVHVVRKTCREGLRTHLVLELYSDTGLIAVSRSRLHRHRQRNRFGLTLVRSPEWEYVGRHRRQVHFAYSSI